VFKILDKRGRDGKPAKLRGRIISDRHGIQVVLTDSKETGKQIVHCLGVTRIDHATTGDRVELTYRAYKARPLPHMAETIAGVWFGRRIS
jgi:hypothetical protein